MIAINTKKILIGTQNPGKFNEIATVLRLWGNDPVSLDSLNITHDVIEDEDTFIGNAIKKATEFCQISGLPTIADDGGLCITQLNDLPGVKSRRWDGSTYMDDKTLQQYTLDQMLHLPEGKRQARLVTVVALALPSGLICYSQKEVPGVITTTPLAPMIAGYPFRPIFWVTKLNKLYADLTPAEHALINHRVKALYELKTVLT